MRLCLFVLAAMLLCLPAPAEADVQIEASAEGEHLRLVIDRDRGRVLVQNEKGYSLVDLAAGYVYIDNGNGAPERIHARYRPGHDAPAPYRLEPFAPGPMIAGHASRYHVLFVDPAVRALALLDDLEGPSGDDSCADIPFPTLAAAGWPLLSGKIDRPTFETLNVRFDYEPKPGELAVPERFDEAPVTRAQAVDVPGGA